MWKINNRLPIRLLGMQMLSLPLQWSGRHRKYCYCELDTVPSEPVTRNFTPLYKSITCLRQHKKVLHSAWWWRCNVLLKLQCLGGHNSCPVHPILIQFGEHMQACKLYNFASRTPNVRLEKFPVILKFVKNTFLITPPTPNLQLRK